MQAFKLTLDSTDVIDAALAKAGETVEEAKNAATALAAIAAGLQPIRFIESIFPLTSLDATEEQYIWDAMRELCIDNDEGDVFDLLIQGFLQEGGEIKLNSRVQIEKFFEKLLSASVNH